MGTTIRVKIYDVNQTKFKEVELLVDTGSTYSWVSKNILRELNIKPKDKKMFKTIEGKLIEREISEAIIEYNKEKVTTIVVFGEPQDSQVFGVYALEGLGLEIDPITKAIKKVEALLAI